LSEPIHTPTTTQAAPEADIESDAIDLPPEGKLRGTRLRHSLAWTSGAWLFGSVWMTSTAGAPLTLFAKSLGLNVREFGILAALPFLASLLSVPASLLIEHTGQRKRIFFWGLYTQRLLWLPIALLPVALVAWLGAGGRHVAVWTFLVLTLTMHAGNAFGGPAWISWMADMVPNRVRGRYFANRRRLGTLSAIPAAVFVGWFVDHYAGPMAPPGEVLRVCGYVFVTAAVVGVLDIACFHFVPEVYRAPRRGTHLLRAMSGPLRDRQFLWFAGFVGTLTFAVSFMAQFVTLYVIQEAGVSGLGTQLMMMVAPLVAQLLVLRLWGRAIDRMGRKPVLKLSTLGFAPVALGWCFLHAGNVWLGYAVSAIGAALWTGVELANFNFVMERAGGGGGVRQAGGGGTSYVAVNSVIVNVAGCLGGLASGEIASLLEHVRWEPLAGVRPLTYYDVLFVLSGVLRLLAAVVFIPHMHEPAAKRGREALWFITVNVYSNVYNLVLQPVRVIRGVPERDARGG
jgi:MFS family permease